MPNEHVAKPSAAPGGRGRLRLAALAGIGLAAVIVAGGTFSRVFGIQAETAWSAAQAIPTVTLAKLQGGASEASLQLPGQIQAFNNAPINARVSGYLRRWYVDIGTTVKQGQLLADIDTPDLDQELAQSRADLATATANEKLAQTTDARWTLLLSHQAVSQQDADTRAADYDAKRAAMNAAADNVRRLEAMETFKRLVAPFDGVVTARNTDIGQLIAAGVSGATPLFMVADERHLRVYVQVPQAYTAEIAAGATAAVTVPEYPDRSFSARVVTNTTAVDPANGSQLTELLIDNTDGSLKPGGYALVRFTLPTQAGVVRIPSSALLTRDTGVSVALLRPNGHVHIQPIRITRDLGTAVEVAGGVSADAPVIDNPADTLQEDDLVRRATTAAPGTAGHG